MTDQPDQAVLANLESTRRELALARLNAARALGDAEHRSRVTFDELEFARNSAERQWLLRQRARLLAPLGAARHPLRTLRLAIEWVVVASRIHRLAPLVEHLFYTASPLRARPIAGRHTDQPDLGDAIRWLGPVSVNGIARQALFAHPASTVRWTASIEPGATLAIECALVPEVARKNSSGVVFEAVVSSPAQGWSARASRMIRPRTSGLDRRWRPLVVNLPRHGTGDIDIELTTSVPPDGTPAFAWAMWGEPRLRWRRQSADLQRHALAVLRRDGIIGALRRLRNVGTADIRADYQRWLATHAPGAEDAARLAAEVAALPLQPLITVVTPVYNTDPKWLRACIESVCRQSYPHWELCLADDASTEQETVRVLEEYAARDARIKVVRLPKNSHISAASNAALDASHGDFVALLDHDDELAPDALAEVVRQVNANPDVDFIYTDEDKIDQAGLRCDPYFKPDWSPEQFLNFMYTNHLMVLRRSLIDQVGRFRLGFEGSQDYDLALRIISMSSRVGHIPKVLYHWRKIPGSAAAEPVAKPWALAAAKRALVAHVERTQVDAEVLDGAVAGLFRVKRRVRGAPLVTLVITTDDRSREVQGRLRALLPDCVESIVRRTTYTNYELLIIDNGRISEATRDMLANVPHRRVSYRIEGDFNFAHKLNFSVTHARGEHLVVLNDDVEVISSEWLSAMLEYSQDPAIGAVGAKLYYPDGRLQHIGIVMGVCGLAAHAFHQAPGHSGGAAGSAMGPRNYSAVTGACMMTRRAVFDQIGGFNERLAIDFNDVDYCLRVRRAGYRIVFTPYAELYHHESSSQGPRAWRPDDAEYMRATWPDVIAADPYYNPNLTRDFPDYRLRS